MGLNPEALAALESLRQQLVADGHPDEREPETAAKKPPRPKRAKANKAKAAKKAAPVKPAVAEAPTDSQQKPKLRVGKDGKVYPTATQKRRARRKRALERAQLEAAAPPAA